MGPHCQTLSGEVSSSLNVCSAATRTSADPNTVLLPQVHSAVRLQGSDGNPQGTGHRAFQTGAEAGEDRPGAHRGGHRSAEAGQVRSEPQELLQNRKEIESLFHLQEKFKLCGGSLLDGSEPIGGCNI